MWQVTVGEEFGPNCVKYDPVCKTDKNKHLSSSYDLPYDKYMLVCAHAPTNICREGLEDTAKCSQGLKDWSYLLG